MNLDRLSTSLDCEVLLTAEGIIVSASPAYASCVSVEREALIGRDVTQIFPGPQLSPDDSRTPELKLAIARAGLEPTIECLRFSSDWSTMWRVSTARFDDPSAPPLLLQRVERLLSPHRGSEDAGLFGDQREVLEKVFERSDAWMVVFEGPELVIELSNLAFEQLLQRPVSRGSRLTDLVSHAELGPLVRQLDRAFQTGQPHDSGSFIFDLGDDDIVAMMSIQPIYGQHDTIALLARGTFERRTRVTGGPRVGPAVRPRA